MILCIDTLVTAEVANWWFVFCNIHWQKFATLERFKLTYLREQIAFHLWFHCIVFLSVLTYSRWPALYYEGVSLQTLWMNLQQFQLSSYPVRKMHSSHSLRVRMKWHRSLDSPSQRQGGSTHMWCVVTELSVNSPAEVTIILLSQQGWLLDGLSRPYS